MKRTYFILIVILLLGSPVKSQTDSIKLISNAEFSYFVFSKIKYPGISELKLNQSVKSLDEVHTLIFNGKDTLILLSDDEQPAFSRLKDINEVRKYQNRFSPVLGAIVGGAGGVLIGAVIGYTASGNDVDKNTLFWKLGSELDKMEGAIIGTIIGAVCGGIIGAVISNSINYTTLDLLSVPEKEKKAKLIKFLRQR